MITFVSMRNIVAKIKLKVAIAVIRHLQNSDQYFVCRRKPGQHLGGYWEFPGGKIKKNESPYQALQRELKEEIGIKIIKALPLLQLEHQYNDRLVALNVWEVMRFEGDAHACEGQLCRWVSFDELGSLLMPEVNKNIIKVLKVDSTPAI